MATKLPGLRREDFHVAIICAIRCEYDAVIFAFDEIWKGLEIQLGNAPGDHNKYTLGRIANSNAVLLLLTGMGKANVASEGTSLRSSYTKIKLAIVTGICGGVPTVGTEKDLVLGDVVISNCIVQFDLGRRYVDGFVTKESIEDRLGRPHESVRSVTAVFETNSGRDHLQNRTSQILEHIQQKASRKGHLYERPPTTDDRLFEPEYPHRHQASWCLECSELGACEAARRASCDELGCDTRRLMCRPRHQTKEFLDLGCNEMAPHDLRIVLGRLGSGDTVMKSGLDRDRIAQEQNLIAFEMEGAGIWDRFPCIVVKGVCDYADSHKNKKFQNFAAARAAAAAKATLEAFPPTDDTLQSRHSRSFHLVSNTEVVSNVQQATRHDTDHEKNRRKLLELLAADHETHKNLNPKRVPGTCEWFLRDQRYWEWLESTTSSIIWVSAGPGRGKSVLARALIDDGRLSISSTNTTVCYFFFKGDDEHRVNIHDALSSILHQLFTQYETESLIEHADNAHKNYGESLRNNFQQLWKILVACASQPGSREIVCVLDALDECCRKGRGDLFQVLETFYCGEQNDSISSKLKFLITSRPYDNLEISFERIATAGSLIRLDGDDKSEEIRHEINLVIDHKVNEFGKDFHKEHRQTISKRLRAMENCTYLWLHPTLSIIDEKPSAYRKPSSVQKLFSSIPSSVCDSYENILNHNQDKKQARCFLNIILAATQPLTLDEVNWALTLQTRNFTNRNELENDLWPRTSLKVTLKNLCGLFVNVFGGKVSFIHQTAREFLTTSSGQPNTWKGSFDMPSAHGKMFISCTRLLSLHEVDIMLDDAFHGRGPPFVTYAAHYWVLHYNSLESGERDKFCDVARRLCCTVSRQAPKWAWYSQIYEKDGSQVRNCTDLTLASYLGLMEVVEHILEKENIDVDSEGGFFGTAIEAAAAGGHLPLVELLILHGATWDVGGGRISTALEIAIIRGHLEVAECLLVHRGDPITDEIVIAATSNGNDRRSVACLIENAWDEIEISEQAVIAAARNDIGGEDIIAFLLDQCRDKIDVTEKLLEAAADNSSYGDIIVALLLERCGDEFDISGRIAEVAAGNRGCGDRIIDLFLEDFGVRFSVTPAVVREAMCHVKTISLLLEKRGHEIEITLRTIIDAVRNPWCGIEVIDLLLKKGGDGVEITQELVMAAAEARSRDKINFILDKYGAQFEWPDESIQAVWWPGRNSRSNDNDFATRQRWRRGRH